MSPHMGRVVLEKEGLDEKRRKLGDFLGNDVFNKLPASEQRLLIDQSIAMKSYSDILSHRISLVQSDKL